MTVAIRDAQLADAPRLTELIIELGHPIEEAQVRANLELLSERSPLPLVATTNGEVVAMCGLSAMVTVHRDAPVGRVSVMIVAEAHRGRGIGALLIAEAEKRLAALGCKILEVTSNVRRERAHQFYEKLGYERTSYRFMKRLA
ncbi:GNAT family N-acetyltransferase [Sphingomonas sp. SM33]|uniref:GNAT family N-acetyltransferase n=1 Tax=Sphingomonas telluris TaxID=2907998 RepID=A0ABS9VRD6_9SPHN|nr:GNAT family N-acetyltransferase [Sphingomonas telluris]